MPDPALIAALTAALLAVAELLRLEVANRRERQAVAQKLADDAKRTRFGAGTYMDAVDITEAGHDV